MTKPAAEVLYRGIKMDICSMTTKEIEGAGFYETAHWAPGCAPSEVRAGAKWPVVVEGLGEKFRFREYGREEECAGEVVGYSEQGYIVVDLQT